MIPAPASLRAERVMKSLLLIILPSCLVVPLTEANAQTCSDQSQPITIYRNAGPPLIIENSFDPCKEAAKRARKLQRQREKLSKTTETKKEEKESEAPVEIVDFQPN